MHDTTAATFQNHAGAPSWTVPKLLLRMLGRMRHDLGMELAFISLRI